MSSKTFLLLALSLAIVLTIASEVAARELAEATNTKDTQEKKSETADYRGGYPGGGYPGGGYPGGGYPGRGYPGGGRGGYCGRYGCCRRNYYGGGCYRCCAYEGEAVEIVTEDKPHT